MLGFDTVVRHPLLPAAIVQQALQLEGEIPDEVLDDFRVDEDGDEELDEELEEDYSVSAGRLGPGEAVLYVSAEESVEQVSCILSRVNHFMASTLSFCFDGS
jgi:hypothetical protein